MKLLLTSKAITNDSIKRAFIELLGKDPGDAQLTFVTTPAYLGRGDKAWFVDEMLSVRNLNFGFFELVELNSLSRERIISRFEASDAVFFSGGNAASLMHAIDKQNLREVIRQFAEEKVYCGTSASTHAASPDLALSTKEKIEAYYQETGYRADSGLGFIDFYIRAHYKEERHAEISEDYVAGRAAELKKPIYALDDQSAVVINGDKIEVVSEGEYKIFGN